MDKQGVLDLAKRLIDENPENILSPESYLSHLGDSYDNAGRVVADVYLKYSGLNRFLNQRETALAGGLHDIGRPLMKDQLFHELRGARYIQEHGLQLDVADNLTEVYRIAQMFTPHFVVSEQFNDENNNEKKKDFKSLDTSLLIPRTWQEKIVVYSELTNINGEQISFKDRITDIQKRYSPGSKFEQTNPSLASAMQKGLKRVLEVCERVQKLRQGKLSEQEIAQYGFL